MDFTTLSRIQFGFTIGFHYLFAVSTLGLTLYILAFESLHVFKKEDMYRRITDFLVRLLAVIFTFGVVTGFMMPFAFGANWSRFSVIAGPVFGIQLTLESLTAFALEAVFVAVLVFGRSKVSKSLYWISALMVFIGSHLSAFWIVSANSWMQTPDGFAVENGKIILTSFFHAIFNPTTIIRVIHVTLASWITGTALTAALAAYYLLKNRHVALSRAILPLVIIHFMVFSILQAGLGHAHIMGVLKHNPVKDAAYEGIFHTTKGATLYAFGIPDEKNMKIHFAIGLPYMLSFLETGSFTSEVKGLEEYPREEWPPVNVIFTTFHLMVMCGALLIVISLIGGFLVLKRKLFESRWFLLILLWTIPLSYIANELGWIGSEIGRQPWTIYKVLKTSDASTTTIPPEHAAISLAFIFCFYVLLSVLFTKKFISAVKKGPQEPEESATQS
ncbi:MAG: cytochrome ubiquinol oxidase subunit I [Victivallales bacterium]|jgi:cytochrome d ubiquinol oxidase subunit I